MGVTNPVLEVTRVEKTGKCSAWVFTIYGVTEPVTEGTGDEEVDGSLS